MHFKGAVTCVGFYSLETDKRGKLTEFCNLITDLGLNKLGTSGNFMGNCYVGSGNVAPTVADTQMGNQLAVSQSIILNTSGTSPTAPYYSWKIRKFRFAAGVAAGNLTEVGMGFDVSSVNNLFSRSLIKDANGNPTTITILSDEILDVSYELRMYINTTDSSGQLVFTGNKGGTYNWLMRPAVVNTSAWDMADRNMGDLVAGPTAYTGNIGSVVQDPVGVIGMGSAAALAYANNSLEAKATLTWEVTQGNAVEGIKSVAFYLGICKYQIEFTPAIPKTNLDTIQLTVGHSWGRKV